MGNKPTIWAIIPAAGVGARMQASKPKQYLPLAGRTVLGQSLHQLATHPAITGIIVALAEHDSEWETIAPDDNCPVITTIGGSTRADSVLHAVQALAEHAEDMTQTWALVHDAARPCLRHEDIDKMLSTLLSHPAGGILGLPVSDTMKRVNAQGEIIATIPRQALWRAATPQLFRAERLQGALESAIKQGKVVTDEASAMELAGYQPMMVAGHADNIKITLPQDLALAEYYLRQQGRA